MLADINATIRCLPIHIVAFSMKNSFVSLVGILDLGAKQRCDFFCNFRGISRFAGAFKEFLVAKTPEGDGRSFGVAYGSANDNSADEKAGEEDKEVGEEETPIQMVECQIWQDDDHVKTWSSPCTCSGSLKGMCATLVQQEGNVRWIIKGFLMDFNDSGGLALAAAQSHLIEAVIIVLLSRDSFTTTHANGFHILFSSWISLAM
ncbi:hypothetical protein OPV22_024212 [Ensete ventricosum]|uniref:Uncharacterized protein n=1 Tax=Ensete ventricosum TaxID=4639 RepID=A0AAV8PDQ6_ENSVE|nr:hypothetical protein OPV22_024212 [Ensete ventricosum]